jgi:hypothetical protein
LRTGYQGEYEAYVIFCSNAKSRRRMRRNRRMSAAKRNGKIVGGMETD